MKTPFFHTIANRLAWLVFPIAVIPILLISYSLHYEKTEEYARSHLSHLQVIFKQTITTIETALNGHKQMLNTAASAPKIAEAFLERKAGGMIEPEPGLQKYIADIINIYGYYDFFLITEAGDIVYTYKKESDYGKNLRDPLLSATPLADAYRSSLTLLDTQISAVDYYPPSKSKAAFIATPVIVNQKIIGLVAIQLDEHFVFDLVKHYNGLGKTGEVVAGRELEAGRIVAAIPLKYDPGAFTNERLLNEGRNATAMVQAIKGLGGAGEVIDYRGIECLAVWGYEPTMGWGVVVKTDKDEVFEHIYQSQKQLLLLLFLVASAIAFLIYFSAKWITEPIRSLIVAMRHFRKGEPFSVDLSRGSGEIGYLAREFTVMANEIRSYHRDLEAKIKARTRELSRAKKELDTYVGIVNRFVITSSTDLEGNITYVSRAFEEVSGYTAAELIGKNHRLLKDPLAPASLFEEMWQTISAGCDWHGELRNITKSGGYYWTEVNIAPLFDDRGTRTGYTAVCRNITDKKTIEEISITDPLTKLYNRRYLDGTLEQNARLYERYGTPFSLIMIDLDHFKAVNDRYGHQAGDVVLETIGALLKTESRTTDVPGRWGGEEFLIILPSTTLEEAASDAEKLRLMIERRAIPQLGHQSASLGVSEYQGSIPKALKEADDALYRAKEGGRNRVCRAGEA